MKSFSGELKTGRIDWQELILIANGSFGQSDTNLAEINLQFSEQNIPLLAKIFSEGLLHNQQEVVTQGAVYGNGKIHWK